MSSDIFAGVECVGWEESEARVLISSVLPLAKLLWVGHILPKATDSVRENFAGSNLLWILFTNFQPSEY